jgi:hypothetical protein
LPHENMGFLIAARDGRPAAAGSALPRRYRRNDFAARPGAAGEHLEQRSAGSKSPPGSGFRKTPRPANNLTSPPLERIQPNRRGVCRLPAWQNPAPLRNPV